MSHQQGMAAVSTFGSAWSWWTKPRCVSWGGCVYVGSVNRNGHPIIEEWTNTVAPRARHRLSSLSNEEDDHNNPALVLEPGLSPIAIYCRHAGDTLLRYRIGIAPFVAGARLPVFAAEQSIVCPGLVTYAQAFVHGGTIHVLMRAGGWSYVKSTDWGATWSAPIVVFNGSGQFYVAAQQVGATAVLRLGVSSHPLTLAEPDQNIYYAELDMSTGSITSGGSTIGNVSGASLPIDYDTLEVAATPAASYKTWVYDVSGSGDPAIVWSSFDNADWPGTSMYHYSTKVGGVWSTVNVVAAGASFALLADPIQPYFGGIQFESADSLLSCRESSGTWTLARHARVAGPPISWPATTIETEAVAGRALVRAWPVVGRDAITRPFAITSNYTRAFNSFVDYKGNVGGSRL